MNEWYYARGGNQLGPVALEALVEMAKSGGLDPIKDLVWTSTMKDWLPAGQVPGIFQPAAGSAAPSSNPYAPPVDYGSDPMPAVIGGGLPDIIPGSQPISPTACIKRGFDLVIRNFGMILLIGLVYVAVSALAGALLSAMDSALNLTPSRSVEFNNPSMGLENQIATRLSAQSRASALHTILSNLLSLFLSLGLTRIGLNLVSGKEFSVAMLFGGGRKLLTAFVASLLYMVMVIIGSILLIVPGIYLALKYGQFMFAIVDRDLGVLDSLKYSASITTNNKVNLILLWLLMILVILAGFLALVLGLIVAIPVIWIAWVVAYRWMQYGYVAALDHPGTKTPMLSETP